MIIKKFQGKTEEEAIGNAKKELGSNVVVMNVKFIKPKGFLRFLKPQLYEVTVALEEESERVSEQKRENPNAEELQKSLSNFSALASNITKSNVGNIIETNESVAGRENKFVQRETTGNAIEEKLDNLQSFLEHQLYKSEEEKEENKENKEEIEEPNENVVFMQLLYNTMIENEVNEQYANQIIDEVEKINKPNMPIDYMLSNIYQKMILKFGKTTEITPASEGPKVVFFIGPTGVGKTTTIAKIASKFCVEDKKKVALLTADTYRIAAAEQLRTYANILEVPFRVVYSTDEIEMALEDFKEYDYILVDTAGHSHQNIAQRDNMNELVHCLGDKAEQEIYLVVSATTKYRDLISITETYQNMVDYKIIFTKLDETTTFGNLLNLKLHTGASLSYVTCGQNVPDDIEKFKPQNTVKQLLGGKK